VNTLRLIPAVKSASFILLFASTSPILGCFTNDREQTKNTAKHTVRSQYEYTAFDTCCEESASSTQNHSSAVCIISQL